MGQRGEGDRGIERQRDKGQEEKRKERRVWSIMPLRDRWDWRPISE
jgi:hypothetical protein